MCLVGALVSACFFYLFVSLYFIRHIAEYSVFDKQKRESNPQIQIQKNNQHINVSKNKKQKQTKNFKVNGICGILWDFFPDTEYPDIRVGRVFKTWKKKKKKKKKKLNSLSQLVTCTYPWPNPQLSTVTVLLIIIFSFFFSYCWLWMEECEFNRQFILLFYLFIFFWLIGSFGLFFIYFLFLLFCCCCYFFQLICLCLYVSVFFSPFGRFPKANVQFFCFFWMAFSIDQLLDQLFVCLFFFFFPLNWSVCVFFPFFFFFW